MMKIHQYEPTATARGVATTVLATAAGHKRREPSSPVSPDRYDQHGSVTSVFNDNTECSWYQFQGASFYPQSNTKRTCNRFIDATSNKHDTDVSMCIDQDDDGSTPTPVHKPQRRVRKWVCDICHCIVENKATTSDAAIDGQVWNGFQERSRRVTGGCTHEEKSMLYVMVNC